MKIIMKKIKEFFIEYGPVFKFILIGTGIGALTSVLLSPIYLFGVIDISTYRDIFITTTTIGFALTVLLLVFAIIDYNI